MSMPDEREIAWVAAELATRAIERAAEDASTRHLEQAAHTWFPDVDPYERRFLVAALKKELTKTAQLLENRNQRRVAEGAFVPLSTVTSIRRTPDGDQGTADAAAA